jgi:hypothetical protein
MRRATFLLILCTLGGCSWDWGGGAVYRTVWSPSPDRPWAPMPPPRPFHAWLGVPPAVWLTSAAPEGAWPEYEPQIAPSGSAIWVAEHWDWDWEGADGWVWLHGRWIDRPGEGYEWNPPAWVHDQHGTYFVPGFFCPPATAADCPSCVARHALQRSAIACRPGLDSDTKHTLARRSVPPPPIAVARAGQ